MSTAHDAGRRRPGSAALLALVLAGAAQVGSAAPVTWQSWTFDHGVSGNYDGLSLENVTFHGRPLLAKLSFPVMRVFYDRDACGPYADRLGGTLSPIPWADDAKLVEREFTLDGQPWYEIGIRDRIGNYDIYQVYYLGADGTIDAHVYSKGLQCVVDHIHYPNWRIDFDLEGTAPDQVLRDTGAGFEALTQEFDANAASATHHAWRVRDKSTGLHVDVLPGFPGFVIPDGGTNVPVAAYGNNTVYGRVYHSSEDVGWRYGPNTQVPFNDGEGLTSAGTVLWYEGYLPHSSSEGSALWHSTGVRLVADLAGSPPPPPPPGPIGTRAYAGGAVAIGDNRPASRYPSAVNVTHQGGTVAKVTLRLNGLSHTHPDDLDIALVAPSGHAVMLMSDAGGSRDLDRVSLTFDSSASATLPTSAQISSGMFRPGNFGSRDAFAAPAPAGPYGTSLAAFNGLPAAGTWRLYVMDDAPIHVGALAARWVLTITTE